MPQLLFAVIDDTTKIWDVLEAWEQLGVSGVTIHDSTGQHRTQGLRDDLPLFPSVRDLLEKSETSHRTMWSVLEDGVDVEAIVKATEAIVGPLANPRTGILFTVPVTKVWGLRPPEKESKDKRKRPRAAKG
jgi:nitrogen regulatory protein PII